MINKDLSVKMKKGRTVKEYAPFFVNINIFYYSRVKAEFTARLRLNTKKTATLTIF